MQNQTNSERSVGRLLLLAIILFLLNASAAIAQCPPGPPQYDIQSVSISTSGFPFIGLGQIATVTARIRNNGPCEIPTGEATAQVTLSSVYFDCNSPTTPINFMNICGGGPWSLLGVITGGGQHNLFFRNNAGPIPVAGALCGLSFHIRGFNVTQPGIPADITLVSGLHFSTTGFDADVTNQFAATTLAVIAFIPPVIFYDFSGTANSCNGILSWKTATEDNVDRFEVEFSINGGQFDKIGIVKATNNPDGSSYKYAYAQGTGKGYYRIKVIDKDGKISYSKIVTLNTACNGNKSISIYPNPVSGGQDLTVISSGYEGVVKGELVGVSGQVVRTYTLKNGTNILPIENLAQSTYMLRVTDATGQAESLRVVIIK